MRNGLVFSIALGCRENTGEMEFSCAEKCSNDMIRILHQNSRVMLYMKKFLL